MSSVRRHVATAERMRLEPVIVYPDRMRALGAEIAGEVGDAVRCVPAEEFTSGAGDDDKLVLVLAGDWYISSRAIGEFEMQTFGVAAARFADRGRIVAPMARLPVGSVRSLIPNLAEKPSGELISEAAGSNAHPYDLDVLSRHRLSDTVATERAERKLFSSLGRRGRSWHTRFVQRYLSIPLTKRLAGLRVKAAQITAVKFACGLLSAIVFFTSGYVAGLVGALAFFFSRVFDSVAGELSSAAVGEDRSGHEKAGFTGDILILASIPLAIATRPECSGAGPWLALITAAGIAASATFTYKRVLKQRWEGESDTPAADDFPARFATPDGAAYGLLLCALIGRLDLFLWAAAVASHLFYILASRSYHGGTERA